MNKELIKDELYAIASDVFACDGTKAYARCKALAQAQLKALPQNITSLDHAKIYIDNMLIAASGEHVTDQTAAVCLHEAMKTLLGISLQQDRLSVLLSDVKTPPAYEPFCEKPVGKESI
ncbi:MAG: hypothetical protein WC907_04795 [Acholeplasmataceae bacterium]|jgi:hypothetical protein